jgi:Fe2+ transport system protein FeoA
MRRLAPLGDPVEIRVKGYDLALRKREAAHIQVEVKYPKSEMIPLRMAAVGEEVELAAVRAGWGLQRRLADLGLIPGVRIKLVSGRSGPVVIEVKGSRLALGAGVAHTIMVSAAVKKQDG